MDPSPHSTLRWEVGVLVFVYKSVADTDDMDIRKTLETLRKQRIELIHYWLNAPLE